MSRVDLTFAAAEPQATATDADLVRVEIDPQTRTVTGTFIRVDAGDVQTGPPFQFTVVISLADLSSIMATLIAAAQAAAVVPAGVVTVS